MGQEGAVVATGTDQKGAPKLTQDPFLLVNYQTDGGAKNFVGPRHPPLSAHHWKRPCIIGIRCTLHSVTCMYKMTALTKEADYKQIHWPLT